MESHSSKSYSCTQCEKFFTKFVIFKKHQKLHHLTPLNCTECDQVFYHKSSMQAHLAKHKQQFQFPCKLCNKAYLQKSALHQHMLNHDEKKHECNICSKRFYRSTTLKFHVRRHSKTEKHYCNICLKAFKDKSALMRHNNTHSGTIRYKCTACDITSVRKDNILRHIKNIHEDKNIEISIEALNKKEQIKVKLKATENISEGPCTKTVENSSVIKCIGNVIPVVVPNMLHDTKPINKTKANLTTTSELNATTIESIKTSSFILTEPQISHKKLSKKYNPIEMYRKIINSDKDFSEEDDTCVDTPIVLAKPIPEQQRSLPNQSNFSEMHWRKNLNYTYQFQDY